MRHIVALGMALVIGAFALIGLNPVQAVAVPDGTVTVISGGLRDTLTVVSRGEQVTWINATGIPVVRLIFDGITGAPEGKGLFTSSISLLFPRPGEYPYTVLPGGKALAIRGRIVVK